MRHIQAEFHINIVFRHWKCNAVTSNPSIFDLNFPLHQKVVNFKNHSLSLHTENKWQKEYTQNTALQVWINTQKTRLKSNMQQICFSGEYHSSKEVCKSKCSSLNNIQEFHNSLHKPFQDSLPLHTISTDDTFTKTKHWASI